MADATLPMPTATTLLQGVNILLGLIKRAPVSSLEAAAMNVDAQMALQHIHNASMAIQEEGWIWNEELALRLDPEPITGLIRIPAATLKIDTSYYSANLDLVQRGPLLYDRVKHTFNIAAPVYVDVVLGLPFEDLTQAMRTYVLVKAGRLFAQGRDGSGATNQFTESMEYEARTKVEHAEDQADDLTMFEKNPHLARRVGRRRRT